MSFFDSLYASDLSNRAKAVYCYLKDRSNKDGICWPGVKTVAKDLSLSDRTVQRAVRELEKAGWIGREARFRPNGGCSSNRYTILK